MFPGGEIGFEDEACEAKYYGCGRVTAACYDQ